MKPIYTCNDFTFYKQPNDLFFSYKSGPVIKLSSFFGLSEESLKDYIFNNFDDEESFIKYFIMLPKLTKNGKLILGNVQEAKDSYSAKVGLLEQKGLAPFEGLLIHNCSAIHMYGMKFPINVYFLDKSMNVIAVFEDVAVNSATPFIQNAYYALETSTGKKDISLGDQLNLVNYSN